MSDEESSNTLSSMGHIVIFSFISIVFIFIAMILLGGFNNYALYGLLNMTSDFVSNGVIPSQFLTTATSTAETYANILPYLDYVWFGGFITLVISSLIFSYLRRRENYFSLFTMAVLGIILVTYVGGFIIQLTTWFRTEILLAVFPTISNNLPLFSWYLNNLGVINLVLISLNVIANFVDLDFSKFNKRKEGETLDEI